MNLEQARYNMVEQQIRPWDVLNQTVLDTFQFLPREKFVPADWSNLAFADIEIPLGKGEFMMPPRVEARMLQALDIQTTDICLEIGTGSGFVTACLAHLGKQVDSVDIRSDFSIIAEEKLQASGITNFKLYNDDASAGWQGMPDKQYDVIAVTAAMPEYQPVFEQRLNVGGRLFIVTGKGAAMHAHVITREDEDDFRRETIFETRLTPMIGTELFPHFEF